MAKTKQSTLLSVMSVLMIGLLASACTPTTAVEDDALASLDEGTSGSTLFVPGSTTVTPTPIATTTPSTAPSVSPVTTPSASPAPTPQQAASGRISALYQHYLKRDAAASEVAAWDAMFVANQITLETAEEAIRNSLEARVKRGEVNADVIHAYIGILGRRPDLAGALHFMGILEAGQMDVLSMRAAIATSPEGHAAIDGAFNKILLRPAFPHEHERFAHDLGTGNKRLGDIEDELLGSQEFQNIYGNDLARIAVAKAYVQILNRAPDADGMASHLQIVSASGEAVARTSLSGSPEAAAVVRNFYAQILAREPAAEDYTARLRALVDGYSATRQKFDVLISAECNARLSCAVLGL